MGSVEIGVFPQESVINHLDPQQAADTVFYYLDHARDELELRSKQVIEESNAEQVLQEVCGETIAGNFPDVTVKRGRPSHGLANVWGRWGIQQSQSIVHFSGITVYGLPIEHQLLIVNGDGGQVLSHEQWRDREIFTQAVRTAASNPKQDARYGSLDMP